MLFDDIGRPNYQTASASDDPFASDHQVRGLHSYRKPGGSVWSTVEISHDDRKAHASDLPSRVWFERKTTAGALNLGAGLGVDDRIPVHRREGDQWLIRQVGSLPHELHGQPYEDISLEACARREGQDLAWRDLDNLVRSPKGQDQASLRGHAEHVSPHVLPVIDQQGEPSASSLQHQLEVASAHPSHLPSWGYREWGSQEFGVGDRHREEGAHPNFGHDGRKAEQCSPEPALGNQIRSRNAPG